MNHNHLTTNNQQQQHHHHHRNVTSYAHSTSTHYDISERKKTKQSYNDHRDNNNWINIINLIQSHEFHTTLNTIRNIRNDLDHINLNHQKTVRNIRQEYSWISYIRDEISHRSQLFESGDPQIERNKFNGVVNDELPENLKAYEEFVRLLRSNPSYVAVAAANVNKTVPISDYYMVNSQEMSLLETICFSLYSNALQKRDFNAFRACFREILYRDLRHKQPYTMFHKMTFISRRLQSRLFGMRMLEIHMRRCNSHTLYDQYKDVFRYIVKVSVGDDPMDLSPFLLGLKLNNDGGDDDDDDDDHHHHRHNDDEKKTHASNKMKLTYLFNEDNNSNNNNNNNNDDDDDDEYDERVRIAAASVSISFTKDIREKCLKQQGMIFKELVQTERDYVGHLRAVKILYMEPIQVRRQSLCITPTQYQNIFQHLNSIFQVNDELLSQLETIYKTYESFQKPKCIASLVADVFHKVSPFLKVYCDYVTSYDDCLDTIDDLKHNKNFMDCIMKLKDEVERELNHRFGLMDYLVMPVQRIPRYQLLLQDLVKKTDPDSLGYLPLRSALSRIADIAKGVNERKRDIEHMSKLLSIQNRLKGLEEIDDGLIQPYRRFIREDIVYIMRKDRSLKPYYMVLFNDAFMYASISSSQIKEFIKLHHASLSTQSDTSLIIQCKDKVIHLEFGPDQNGVYPSQHNTSSLLSHAKVENSVENAKKVRDLIRNDIRDSMRKSIFMSTLMKRVRSMSITKGAFGIENEIEHIEKVNKRCEVLKNIIQMYLVNIVNDNSWDVRVLSLVSDVLNVCKQVWPSQYIKLKHSIVARIFFSMYLLPCLDDCSFSGAYTDFPSIGFVNRNVEVIMRILERILLQIPFGSDSNLCFLNDMMNDYGEKLRTYIISLTQRCELIKHIQDEDDELMEGSIILRLDEIVNISNIILNDKVMNMLTQDYYNDLKAFKDRLPIVGADIIGEYYTICVYDIPPTKLTNLKSNLYWIELLHNDFRKNVLIPNNYEQFFGNDDEIEKFTDLMELFIRTFQLIEPSTFIEYDYLCLQEAENRFLNIEEPRSRHSSMIEDVLDSNTNIVDNNRSNLVKILRFILDRCTYSSVLSISISEILQRLPNVPTKLNACLQQCILKSWYSIQDRYVVLQRQYNASKHLSENTMILFEKEQQFWNQIVEKQKAFIALRRNINVKIELGNDIKRQQHLVTNNGNDSVFSCTNLAEFVNEFLEFRFTSIPIGTSVVHKFLEAVWEELSTMFSTKLVMLAVEAAEDTICFVLYDYIFNTSSSTRELDNELIEKISTLAPSLTLTKLGLPQYDVYDDNNNNNMNRIRSSSTTTAGWKETSKWKMAITALSNLDNNDLRTPSQHLRCLIDCATWLVKIVDISSSYRVRNKLGITPHQLQRLIAYIIVLAAPRKLNSSLIFIRQFHNKRQLNQPDVISYVNMFQNAIVILHNVSMKQPSSLNQHVTFRVANTNKRKRMSTIINMGSEVKIMMDIDDDIDENNNNDDDDDMIITIFDSLSDANIQVSHADIHKVLSLNKASILRLAKQLNMKDDVLLFEDICRFKAMKPTVAKARALIDIFDRYISGNTNRERFLSKDTFKIVNTIKNEVNTTTANNDDMQKHAIVYSFDDLVELFLQGDDETISDELFLIALPRIGSAMKLAHAIISYLTRHTADMKKNRNVDEIRQGKNEHDDDDEGDDGDILNINIDHMFDELESHIVMILRFQLLDEFWKQQQQQQQHQQQQPSDRELIAIIKERSQLIGRLQRNWMEKYYDEDFDFTVIEILLNGLKDYPPDELRTTKTLAAFRLFKRRVGHFCSMLEDIKRGKMISNPNSNDRKVSKKPFSGQLKGKKIAKTVSEQLTLLSASLWNDINYRELAYFDAAATTTTTTTMMMMDSLPTCIVAYLNHHEKFSKWIQDVISNDFNTLEILKFFIDVGTNLLKLGNFEGIIVLMTSLQSETLVAAEIPACIDKIDRKYKEKWNTLTEIARTAVNFRGGAGTNAYIRHLNQFLVKNLPRVPFLAFHLGQIARIPGLCNVVSNEIRLEPHIQVYNSVIKKYLTCIPSYSSSISCDSSYEKYLKNAFVKTKSKLNLHDASSSYLTYVKQCFIINK